jgi:3-oxoacyl-[acyl-carrier protein] reductase
MSETAPVALVTGSRKGIGRSLAEHLLRGGYQVVGCSRQPAEWEAPGYTHMQADVSEEEQVGKLFRFLRQQHAGLDVAINNAAVASMNHALLTPASSIEKMLRVNVMGTFLVCREAAKLMKPRGSGRIVNVSSLAVPMRLAGQAAYVASKAGVEAMSQVLARELADFGITVNVIGPTPIDTDMIRGVPDEKMERLVSRLAIKRLGTMEDVLNVVDFFLQPGSAAVTGQIVYLGGVTGA